MGRNESAPQKPAGGQEEELASLPQSILPAASGSPYICGGRERALTGTKKNTESQGKFDLKRNREKKISVMKNFSLDFTEFYQ